MGDIMETQDKLLAWAESESKIGSVIGALLRDELAKMAICDEYQGLDSRLATELRQSEEKPVSVEVVPSLYIDDLSGDYYNDRALIFADGTVEIVSYKGEGEGSFDTIAEYRDYVLNKLNPDNMDYNYDKDWD